MVLSSKQEGEIVQCRWRKKTADPQDVTILLLAPKKVVEERLAVIREEAKAVKDKERRVFLLLFTLNIRNFIQFLLFM